MKRLSSMAIILVLVALLATSCGGKLSETRADLSALQARYTELELTHAATMEEFGAMKAEYQKLKAKHADTLSELDDFKSKCTDYEAQISALNTDLSARLEELENLRKEVSKSEFSLHSCEVIDNYGFPSLAISFDTSSDVSVHLKNSLGNEIDSLNAARYTKKAKLHLTDFWNTAPVGIYILTVTNQIGDIIFERELPFDGAKLSIAKCTPSLNSGVLIMHVKNDGDLPIYLCDGEISIGSAKASLSFGVVGISPGQEKVIIGYTFITNTNYRWYGISIALKDFSGNVVLTHSEPGEDC